MASEVSFARRVEFYRTHLRPHLADRRDVTPSEVFGFMGGNPNSYDACKAEAICAILFGLGYRPRSRSTWSIGYVENQGT